MVVSRPGKNLNHKSFGKVLEMCYNHIIYTEFDIINMFFKERRSKYKPAYALTTQHVLHCSCLYRDFSLFIDIWFKVLEIHRSQNGLFQINHLIKPPPPQAAGAGAGPDGGRRRPLGEARRAAGRPLRRQGAPAGRGRHGDGDAPPPGEARAGGRRHRAHDVIGECPCAATRNSSSSSSASLSSSSSSSSPEADPGAAEALLV